MASQAQNVTVFNSLLKDFWLDQGVPARLWDETGKRWRSLQKMANNGWSGKGEINYPSQTHLPSAGSADFATAWANSNPHGSNQWRVTRDQRWQVMQLNWEVMELSQNAQFSYLRAQRAEQEAHMRRYLNLMSFFCYQNGGGAVGRIQSSTTASGVTTITLQNPKCAKFFESQTKEGVGGDYLQFSSDDGSSSPSGLRQTEVRRVVAVLAQAGQIQVTPPLSAPIADGDYIFMEGDYGKSFRGVTAWTPLVSTNLGTDFFGVDRSVRPDRLAGTRIPYKSGASPFSVIQEALTTACELGISINRMTVQASEWEKVFHDLHAANVTFRTKNVSSNAATLQVGYTSLEFIDARFEEPIEMYADRYWELPDVDAATTGGVYLFDRRDDERWYTYPSGLSWKDYDGNGPVRQVLASQVLAAQFGHFGQSVLRNTKNRMVVGPSSVVVS